MSTIKRNWLRLLCGLLFALLASGAGAAQTVTGTISGTVSDASGQVIAGAKVTLTNQQTGSSRTLTSNESGNFSFAAMQPGIYTVKVEHPGFRGFQRENTVLSANENLALGKLELSVGQVTEVVTVTAEGAIVEKASSDLTARLTSDQIALISTKGRDVTSLLRLLPGTSNNDDIESAGDGFGTDLPNISGQRGRSTVATIDGLNAAEPSGSNKLSMTINQDAVAEVKVLRDNYAAEYGNNGGAMINLVSRGGTRNYTGSAYYFLRNEALNGNNFFSNKAGLQRPLYRFNYWGFNVGGPIQLPKKIFGPLGMQDKNKAFFFFSFEKPHTITPTDPVFVTVPTALERKGDFSQSINSSGAVPVILNPLTGLQFQGNVIPPGLINKSGQALLNYYPLPNAPGGKTAAGAAYNYVFQRSVDVPKHSYVLRFDVKPTDKDSIYFKAQWWTSDNEGTATSGWPNGGGGVDRWGIRSHYLYTDNGRSAGWIHVFSPTVVNEFNFGWRTDTEGFVPTTGFAEGLTRAALNYTAPQLFADNNTLGLIPRATGWSSVAGNPANINWLDRWGEVGADHISPSFSDNLSYSRGAHNYKFGVYFERLLNREAPGGQWSGVFDFGTGTGNGFTTAAGNTGFAYANALLGNFNSYSEQSARPFTNEEIRLIQWYAQDQWKVSNRLTVNYGLRFGYHSPFHQIDGQGSNFDPSRFDATKSPLLYIPFCKGGTPAVGTACAAANQFAIDPREASNTNPTLFNKNLVRAIIPGSGNTLDGLALPTDPTTPEGYRHTAPVDFEPRVGFAFDIFGTGKTVLRAMGGVYHAPRIGGGTGGASSLGNNPPQQRTFQILNGNIDQLANLTSTAALFPVTISAVEANSQTPTSYNFSFGVQQDIGFKTVMEVSYVGSLTRHLGQRRNINALPDGAKFVDCRVISASLCHPANRDPLTASSALNNDFLRPIRGYGDINVVTWDGTSNYNSLQVQINRRYTRSFQYGVAYTYSKSFDYANDDTSDLSSPRPYKAFNYAPSDFDQTHILSINYIYDVPNLSRKWDNVLTRTFFSGWQLSGTTSYATGKPKNLSVSYTSGTVTITTGQTCPAGSFQTSATVCTMITDFTGGTVNARPFQICNPTEGAHGSDPTGTPYVINTSCFAPPTALGQIGNMPRNSVRIPSIFNNDLAFFKNFKLGEKRGIQFRWEMYNIFNRANFRDIDGSLTYALTSVTNTDGTKGAVVSQTRTSFGTPTSARTPRVMQGSLRINF